MTDKIPVTALVMTRNEAARIESCLVALSSFSEVIVVDSGSTDGTATLALAHGAHVEHFVWNGAYPKKRQWCLDHLKLANDWVFFIDADEVLTPALEEELRDCFSEGPTDFVNGIFVRGCYVVDGKVLRHGQQNNKLALFDRNYFSFPRVDDLDLPGMGEIEGHYQPMWRHSGAVIVQADAPLLHYAYDGGEGWLARHRRYAAWEAGMNARNAWPADPVSGRQFLKRLFRALPCRGVIAFLYSYVWKSGWRDGTAGYLFARDRWRYYGLIAAAGRELRKRQ